MAALIRDHAWADTPIGPREEWPTELRVAVSMALGSPMLATVLWGRDFRMIYNDVYMALLDGRHPNALGEPIPDVWFEVGEMLRRQLTDVLDGGMGFVAESQRHVIFRGGRATETFWCYSFMPIRDAQGSIVGLFNTGFEVTAAALAARRQSLLIGVADILRAHDDPDAMAAAAAELVGVHLGADRCGYGHVSRDGMIFSVRGGWAKPELQGFEGDHRIDDFGFSLAEALRAGSVVRIGDVTADGRLRDDSKAAFAAIGGVQSAMVAPFVKDGRMRGAFFAHRVEPQAWSDSEAELILEVGERIAAAVDRADTIRELAAREAELREAVSTRDLLVGEVNHRVKNSLQIVSSVLNIEAKQTLGAEARTRLEAAAGRVRAIAAVHASLYRTGDVRQVELAGHLERLCGQLGDQDQAVARGVVVRLRAAPVDVPTEMAVTISLLVNELVSNSIEHGYPDRSGGTVTVELTATPEGGIDLSVRDDGWGGADPEAEGGGLGSRLAVVFARQLGTEAQVTRTPAGRSTRLRFQPEG